MTDNDLIYSIEDTLEKLSGVDGVGRVPRGYCNGSSISLHSVSAHH